MILIISENDQIIGADEEFLEDKGLDYIKENFPSMSIFLLQSENGTFNFTYNEKEYIVTKYPITMDITNANLYCFETPKDNMETQPNQETQPIIEPKKDNNDSLNTPFLEENEISSLDSLKQTNSEDSLANQELNFESAPPSNDSNNEMELDLGITPPSNDSNNEMKLDLDLTSPSNESDNEVELDLGITPSSNESNNEVELDLGITPPSNDSNNEMELDLDLTSPSNDSNNKVELDLGLTPPSNDSNNEVELDLGLNSPSNDSNNEVELDLDLTSPSNDSNNEMELDLGLTPPSNESDNEVELDLDLGFDSLTESKGIDIGVDGSNDGVISISKEEIEADLKQASQELGIDNATLQEFFKDFKQQLVDEKEIFLQAIKNKDYETLHKSSHKLKGVALNLRLNKFAELLKNSDNLAKEKADITKIQKIIENIYSAIGENKETENSFITIETNLNDDEKTILLKAVVNFLGEIQTKDLESIKEEILNAYNIVPIKEFKDIEKIDNLNEANNFITNLIEKIKKEIK